VCLSKIAYRRGTMAAEASQLTPTRVVRVALTRILARFGYQEKLCSLGFTVSFADAVPCVQD
jgi:hypothetical protein